MFWCDVKTNLFSRGSMVAIRKQLALEGRLQKDQQTSGARENPLKAHSLDWNCKPDPLSTNPPLANSVLVFQLRRVDKTRTRHFRHPHVVALRSTVPTPLQRAGPRVKRETEPRISTSLEVHEHLHLAPHGDHCKKSRFRCRQCPRGSDRPVRLRRGRNYSSACPHTYDRDGHSGSDLTSLHPRRESGLVSGNAFDSSARTYTLPTRQLARLRSYSKHQGAGRPVVSVPSGAPS